MLITIKNRPNFISFFERVELPTPFSIQPKPLRFCRCLFGYGVWYPATTSNIDVDKRFLICLLKGYKIGWFRILTFAKDYEAAKRFSLVKTAPEFGRHAFLHGSLTTDKISGVSQIWHSPIPALKVALFQIIAVPCSYVG